MSGAQARALGERAERAAAWHLRLRGWRLLARNWVGGGGELDLVASRWRTLLVAEVRLREDQGAAGRSIDAAKLARVLAAARALIRQHGLHRYRLRIDLFLYDREGRLERRRDVLRRPWREPGPRALHGAGPRPNIRIGMRWPWLLGSCLALLLAVIVLGAWWLRGRPAAPPPVAPPAPLQVLLVGDPFAPILEREAPALLAPQGLMARFERAGYDAIRQSILAEQRAPSGQVDIVAFDVVWTAELAERGALLPLDELCARDRIDLDAYLPPALDAARWQGRLYGLPIQPHAELLWARRDLLAAAGLALPRTPDELLAAARALHRPEAGIHGIVWNAQRGSALGQTMAHLYAAFGQPLLDARGRPSLDGPRAIEAVRFARELVAVSPPDILTTAWDQRRRRFIAGQAALTYEWGARMGEGLASPECRVRGLVLCAPPPVAPGVRAVAPFGTWCLGILAVVPEARRAQAWQGLRAVCTPAAARRLAEAGNAGVSVRELLQDPRWAEAHGGLFPVMRALLDAGAFDPAVRPATPQWDELCHLMGEVYHEVLRGQLTPEAAIAEAQRRALALWPGP